MKFIILYKIKIFNSMTLIKGTIFQSHQLGTNQSGRGLIQAFSLSVIEVVLDGFCLGGA